MRLKHVIGEAFQGLFRNGSITLSIIVTMWVSLTLFGAGLLLNSQVSLMKGDWYDKIEISVFLCNAETQGDNCTPGQDVTDEERELIKETLTSSPQVAEVYHESKEEAYAAFQRSFKDSPVANSLRPEQMQESFRVKLANPEEYQEVVSKVAGLPGVEKVQDLRQYLDSLFRMIFWLQTAALVASGLLLLAAAMQIGNSIRMVAFTRRREIGIMRLVGASNSYIVLPILIEMVISAVIGAALACVTLGAGVYFLHMRNTQPSSQTLAMVGWNEAGLAMAGVAIVALVLSIIPTLVATRRYLRV